MTWTFWSSCLYFPRAGIPWIRGHVWCSAKDGTQDVMCGREVLCPLSHTPALTALVNRIVVCNVHTKHRQLSVSLVYSELFVKPVLQSSFILFLHQRQTNPLAFTFSLSQSHCPSMGDDWFTILFLSIWFTLDIACKWNHTTCNLCVCACYRCTRVGACMEARVRTSDIRHCSLLYFFETRSIVRLILSHQPAPK